MANISAILNKKNTERCFFIALKRKEGEEMEEYNYCMIPLTTEPNQQMQVKVPINKENISFLLTIRYNNIAQYWNMDIADGNTGEMILSGLLLLVSESPAANLLEQYSYLNIGSMYVVKVNESIKKENPDNTNLGTDFVLIWGDNIE